MTRMRLAPPGWMLMAVSFIIDIRVNMPAYRLSAQQIVGRFRLTAVNPGSDLTLARRSLIHATSSYSRHVIWVSFQSKPFVWH